MHRDLWTPLHARLHQTLRDRHLLQAGQSILIAVSGGQDSLCLLKLLLDLQPKWHWQLAVIHCDHRWRPDSVANAQHVQALIQSWALPFYLQVAEPSPASEASARAWRYQCFINQAEQSGQTAVITGHTASDRAETLLYNLFRGSGANGLKALTWQRQLTPKQSLIRPLLNVTRAETGQFCQTHQLPLWEDATNHDLKYARNRIREEILPYLATHFNPKIAQTLAQTAELLDQEVAYLEDIATQHRLAATIAPIGEPDLYLNRDCLKSLPIALQRRVMRQFLQIALNLNTNFEQIEKLTALVTAPNRSCTDPFPGGIIAEVQNNLIRLRKV